MGDKSEYKKVRDKIVDMLRKDLIGPLDDNEVLETGNDRRPKDIYIIGKLAPQTSLYSKDASVSEQEIEADAAYDEGADYTAGKDDDNEPISVTRFKQPTSAGVSFYIESSTPVVRVDVSWGDYLKKENIVTNKDGTESTSVSYARQPMKETVDIRFADFVKNQDYRLSCDSNVCLHVSKIALKKDYLLVSVYVINKRRNYENDIESNMFQVEIKAYSPDNSNIFIAEHICREVLASDEYYFVQRPVFGRGRGCAATWGPAINGRTSYVKSDFIPDYEIPNVSADIPEFGESYFSTGFMSSVKNRNETIGRLDKLADTYEKWIHDTLEAYPAMSDDAFREKIGNDVIEKCKNALARIREGIMLLADDDIAFDAFCFMNRTILMQRSIMNYAKAHGDNPNCNFKDFVKSKGNEKNDFIWRPFQIAFILMNLNAIADSAHKDREIVDLLYFPTGGGKTEAYLGLMAFTIANRRLRADENDDMNRDGGVTVILRYTLRLLTTQQRDRIIRMVMAAELLRKKAIPKYGTEPISIGFWVGGGVTPNKFKDLEEKPGDPQGRIKAAEQKRHIIKQLLTCPFCGAKLTEDEFYIDTDTKSVTIYCADETCLFYKYRKDKNKIPVYLVDEEIYAKCPTIILSTVDKFAVLPWGVKPNALFGRVDRNCSKCGYIASGDKHPSKHKRKSCDEDKITVKDIKPFLPPELIIQDELHLITGPLGTIYGAYETIIEDLCSYRSGDKIIKPKYIVSTATIKNAEEQVRCLYARKNTAQFPPNGFEIGDSLFIREKSVAEEPFRKYVGISAPGQSVKTALLRTYAILLQEAWVLFNDEKCKAFVDPYYTLIGYYNSIRELGGAARLLQDDIPKRIKQIQTKYAMDKVRYLNRKIEITSRMSSYDIPRKLKQLETKNDSRDCLDTAIATNMIAVGMDVDRLGLMVVTGQPKQNSEYIQATSRIGRNFPGLVVMLYNPYRPRDLSHYENFTGYHSQLYRFVEGTTATPFSARARDRVLHALIITAMRMHFPEMAANESANAINNLSSEKIEIIKKLIISRLNIVKPLAIRDAEEEIDMFINHWKRLADGDKPLFYNTDRTDKYRRLMNYYGENVKDSEKATLVSMRDVEKSANIYYYSTEG